MKIKQLEPSPIIPRLHTENCCAKEEVGEWIVEVRGNGWNEDFYLTCPNCGRTFKNLAGFPNTCPACGKGMKR